MNGNLTISNITNHEVATIKNCDSEPIHIPGSIQQHGFLLAVNELFEVEACSENCLSFIGKSPKEIIGTHLASFLDAGQLASFTSYSQRALQGENEPFVFTIDDVAYNTAVHKSGTLLLLELEPIPTGTLSLPDMYVQSLKIVEMLQKAASLQELCQVIADDTRSITGYDRVMVYRFDKEYNGEVFAESIQDGLHSFLGHRYPHTDIPVQARKLYLSNLMRMIVDCDYTPVPLLIKDDGTKTSASVDLSQSVLRSVSPIHIQYLKNMGVKATLTISLILEGKLWGMIVCHHYTARNLPHYTRLSALLQGHFLTSQIRVRELAEDFALAEETGRNLQEALPLINELPSQHLLVQNAALLGLANAGGVVILHQGHLHTGGNVPSKEELLALIDWLTTHKKPVTFSFHTHTLFQVYEPSAHFSDTGAGIFYYSLTEAASRDCIIWFRPEVEKVYNWAGKPTEDSPEDADKPLTPRKSFELWKEQVKGNSLEWRNAELNAANTFAQALQRHYHLLYAQHEEERYKNLNEQLQAANEELSNINWISTHDLKEPLRKIRIFSSKILSSEDSMLSGKGLETIGRIEEAATRMQQLVDDLLLYSNTVKGELVYEHVNLNEVLTGILPTFEDEIQEKKAVITVGSLPEIQGIPFQMEQLFINLISNGLKYRDAERAPEIKIAAEQVEGRDYPGRSLKNDRQYWYITIADNGIGFESQFSEKIFDVFQRLHGVKEFSGTGVGLAICRKIMQNHKGAITAESEPHQGATFQLFFPVS